MAEQRTSIARVLAPSCVLLCASCSLFGGLRVEALGTSSQRPSNVAAYVSVSDGNEPVTELDANDFAVYENGQRISTDQSQQVLLDKDLVASHRTLLAVDLSTATTAERRTRLGKAISGFLEKVRPTQPVTVYAFGGGANLRLLGEYAKSAEGVPTEAPWLGEASRLDASRNLNGAVKQALKELDARLLAARKPIRVGTLVVFAGGPDVAGRVSQSELDELLDASKHLVIAIGVGPEPPNALRNIGRDGFVAAESADTLGIAFEEASYRVRAGYEKHYLFAYCSPARAGTRRLRLEARFTARQGDEKKGSMEADFDARGFGPGCNPRSVPRFVVEPTARGSSGFENSSKPAEPADESAPTESNDGDDGAVVPPPDRPGYAK